jgi:hypothetical protein
MTKVRFQIGTANYVQISLPSKLTGDGDTYVGKAKVHVSTLSCSQNIKIHKSDLSSFFAQVAKAYKTLKGAFTLESGYGTFSLRGEVTRKGQVRVVVKVGYPVSNHPDYTEWQTEAAFNCDPEDLRPVLACQSAT